MCATPAVSIPVWLGTGSAQVGTDGIGPEANLANEATAGKARSCSPRFRGTSLLFPPPAAERGEGRHRPAPTESRAGPADELAKPPTACASHWMTMKVPKRYTRS